MYSSSVLTLLTASQLPRHTDYFLLHLDRLKCHPDHKREVYQWLIIPQYEHDLSKMFDSYVGIRYVTTYLRSTESSIADRAPSHGPREKPTPPAGFLLVPVVDTKTLFPYLLRSVELWWQTLCLPTSVALVSPSPYMRLISSLPRVCGSFKHVQAAECHLQLYSKTRFYLVI